MTLSLGFSPCPNDTFIFDAMVHGKIDTEGLNFEVQLGDVEALNQLAFKGSLDITKLSYHAFAYLLEQYVLLDAGSALGNNCGPLLIAKQPLSKDEINQAKIAIPGKYTTANLLLGLAYPNAQTKKEYVFSDIESAVLNGDVDAGLIIHENRFTYQDKGLIKLIDLGEFWEKTTKQAIPLGGIVVKRTLAPEIQQKINRVMARSVQFALDNPQASSQFVQANAQEMNTDVMYQHINLYVNNYTANLGKEGKAAVSHLFQEAKDKQIIPINNQSIFL
ncbi:MAG: 1,4-dihydroxy-6-naphthoate synthase [Saprospiraceae bacterium]